MGFYAYFNDPSQQIVDKVSFVQKKAPQCGAYCLLTQGELFCRQGLTH